MDINEQFTDFLTFKIGDGLPRVPSFNVGFNTVYTTAIGETGWRFAGSAGLSHMGNQIAIDENRSEGDQQTMARMRLGVRNKNYEVSLFGNNLFGESGVLFANVAGGRSLSTQAFSRQLGVELSVSF